MNARGCKVMESSVSLGAVEVRMRGAWLREAGFALGCSVRIENPAAGQLVLTVNSPPQLTAEDFTAYCEHADRVFAAVDSQGGES